MNKIGYRELPIAKIRKGRNLSREYPSGFKDRKEDTEENRQERDKRCNQLGLLDSSIKELKILQNLIVRPIAGTDEFELICGYNRLDSTRESSVMCLVIECNDSEALYISFIENYARESLDPFQEAWTFKRLKDDYETENPDSKKGGDQSKREHECWAEYFSKKTEISTDYLYKRLKLLELPTKVAKPSFGISNSVKEVIASKVKGGTKQEEYANVVKENKLSVEETKELIEYTQRAGVRPNAVNYPLREFVPPKALLNDVWKLTGRLEKALYSNLSYMSDSQKETMLDYLTDHRKLVDKAILKLEIMASVFALEKRGLMLARLDSF